MLLLPLKIFNPPFSVLKAAHSVSYSCVCDVCRESFKVGFFIFFLNFPVWLVCYAHVVFIYMHTLNNQSVEQRLLATTHSVICIH